MKVTGVKKVIGELDFKYQPPYVLAGGLGQVVWILQDYTFPCMQEGERVTFIGSF